jgi:hypothetical protein
MSDRHDMVKTQELPICEAPARALDAIEFWEKTAIASAIAEVDYRLTVRPASQWSARSIDRLLANVRGQVFSNL